MVDQALNVLTAILTFEKPHSSNKHVAYITNTSIYVIIEIICLCLN